MFYVPISICIDCPENEINQPKSRTCPSLGAILSFMRIDGDIYDLACIQLCFNVTVMFNTCSFTLFICLCSCKRDTIQCRIK